MFTIEKSKCKLVCFDFDGLLVNTEELHFRAYNAAVKEYGYSLSWDFFNYCKEAHVSSEVLASAIYTLCPGLKDKEPHFENIRSVKIGFYEKLIQSSLLSLMDGAEYIINMLTSMNIPMAIVTNSPKIQIEVITEMLPPLSLIPTVISRECYSRSKPHPDGYNKALELHSVESHHAIGFEDTIKGVRSLSAALIQPIIVCSPENPHLKDFPDLDHITTLRSVTVS